MSDLRQLQDQLRRQRVEAVRQRHPLDKALAGARLYDMVLERMAWGVKMEFPDADEATLRRIVFERVREKRLQSYEREPRPFLLILDTRPAAQAAAAPVGVNIPWEELPRRMHELPAKGTPLAVYDEEPPRQTQAVAMLRERGYPATAATADDLAEARVRPAPAQVSGRLWSPSAFLVEVWALMQQQRPPLPGASPWRVLDVACGAGREAVWLAQQGCDVEAVDVLPDALAKADDLARRSGVTIRTRAQDVITMALAPASYDLITVFRFLHRPLLPRLAAALRPQGFLLYETFHATDSGREGRPLTTAHVWQNGEPASLLATLAPLLQRDGVAVGPRRMTQYLGRRP